MTSVDTLLTRAKRLHGMNDDALEEEWANLCSVAHEELIKDLEEQIARMTPEEQEAEQQNSVSSFSPAEEAEFEEWLSRGAKEAKAAYFANARRKKRER